MSDLEANTSAQAIIDTATDAANPTPLDTERVYSQVVRGGASLQTLDLEKFLPAPRRVTGSVQVQTVDDLVRYTRRHDDAAETTIWVDANTASIVTVLNDHAQGASAWGDHRATLRLKPTPEWLHWTNKDGQLLSQEDFAEHIEDGYLELVDPDAATMLEVAQSIQGTRSAEFKQATRLQDGNVGVQYVEQTTATAGQRGELEIPEILLLGISPFLGEEPAAVRARLRWRLRDGGLKLGYKLERPDRVIRGVVDAISDRLATEFGVERVFIGTPRA